MSGPITHPGKQKLLWASVFELVTLFDSEADRLTKLIFPVASGQYLQVPPAVVMESQKCLFGINAARSQFNEYVRSRLAPFNPAMIITEEFHPLALELSYTGKTIVENLATIALLYQEHMSTIDLGDAPNGQ